MVDDCLPKLPEILNLDGTIYCSPFGMISGGWSNMPISMQWNLQDLSYTYIPCKTALMQKTAKLILDIMKSSTKKFHLKRHPCKTAVQYWSSKCGVLVSFHFDSFTVFIIVIHKNDEVIPLWYLFPNLL